MILNVVWTFHQSSLNPLLGGNNSGSQSLEPEKFSSCSSFVPAKRIFTIIARSVSVQSAAAAAAALTDACYLILHVKVIKILFYLLLSCPARSARGWVAPKLSGPRTLLWGIGFLTEKHHRLVGRSGSGGKWVLFALNWKDRAGGRTAAASDRTEVHHIGSGENLRLRLFNNDGDPCSRVD